MNTVGADARAGAWPGLLVSLSDTWKQDPRAVWSSFAMIMASEIGDKTFLIAAILSMRQPRLTVFLGAFGALALMSILSSFLGATFPSLLPKALTTFLAALLFFVFGLKMLKEAKEMTGEEMNDEMEEARKEVEDEQIAWNSNVEDLQMRDIEEATGSSYPNFNIYPRSPNINLNRSNEIVFDRDENEGAAESSTSQNQTTNGGSVHKKPEPRTNGHIISSGIGHSASTSLQNSATHLKEGARNLCGLCFSPVFAQAFVLTFLGEWGDRSQIATIALAAAHNVVLVSLGTIAGHAICTGLAVLGGSALAARISVKHVTFFGSILFLLFGVIYLFESFSEYSSPSSIQIEDPSLLPVIPHPIAAATPSAILEAVAAKVGEAAVGLGNGVEAVKDASLLEQAKEQVVKAGRRWMS